MEYTRFLLKYSLPVIYSIEMSKSLWKILGLVRFKDLFMVLVYTFKLLYGKKRIISNIKKDHEYDMIFSS